MGHKKDIESLCKIPGVTKVGYGLKETKGNVLPQMVYRVYVKRKKALSELTSEEQIPRSVSNIGTDVLVDDANTAQNASTTSIDASDQISRYASMLTTVVTSSPGNNSPLQQAGKSTAKSFTTASAMMIARTRP